MEYCREPEFYCLEIKVVVVSNESLLFYTTVAWLARIQIGELSAGVGKDWVILKSTNNGVCCLWILCDRIS